jgi:hypothetical protein
MLDRGSTKLATPENLGMQVLSQYSFPTAQQGLDSKM